MTQDQFYSQPTKAVDLETLSESGVGGINRQLDAIRDDEASPRTEPASVGNRIYFGNVNEQECSGR